MFEQHGRTRVSKVIGPLLVVFLGLAAFQAHADPGDAFISQATDPSREIEYFTLDESTDAPEAAWQDPATFFRELDLEQNFEAATKSAVSLLKWVHHRKAPPVANESYSRRKHFGGWVREAGDGTCQNVRAKVLIRDSSKPVTFRDNNKCLVDKGLWKDPYTGDLYDSSRQIHIDHMVPLKHAYIAGGWQWTPQKRCLYGNFMANSYHLIASSSRENMRKGDRGPDDYMPPNKRYQCAYLTNWLKIKLIWNLMIFSGEAERITQLLNENNCSVRSLQISQVELTKMRDQMSNTGLCKDFDERRGWKSTEPVTQPAAF